MDFKSFQDPRAPKASEIRIDQEKREREREMKWHRRDVSNKIQKPWDIQIE